ncbi:MAG TPA: uroporphyrinogen-III C-methyltransferase [Mycobacteriales bacterium]|jgi:uroporphyrinogen III methyltransferase/synthase|nr:uroporphyrinogen-III C-methyltransferase [Mycobacteriales bacterium]
MTARKQKGTVALVGAGPGDPGLLTLRGRELLERADVVVVDRLASPALLAYCRPDAEIVDAGKAPHGEGMTQADINALAVGHAKEGRNVVRLKGGDPFVFGRGGEEAEACVKAKVPWEVVPGVTSAVAVPAYAGIPVTHRGRTQDFAVISGHVDPSAPDSTVDWRALAAGPGTIVLLMGVEKIGKIAAKLIEHGRPGDTPVAMTRWGTTAKQRTVVADLNTIEEAAAAAAMTAPAVTVIGPVVALRERLNWYESRPLFGMTVLVPRTRQQAGTLSYEVRALGGEPLEVPTIAVEPPRNPEPMRKAVSGLVQGRYQWVAFTSVNAVRAVREGLESVGLDPRALAGVKIAAVGDATVAALREWGLFCDLVPSDAMSSDELGKAWPPYDAQLDFLDRILLPRADIATETLVTAVKAKGWAVDEVTAYRTVRAQPPADEVKAAVRNGDVDAVVFTSSSTVRNLVALCGKPHERTLIAAIGPQTAAAAREAGLRVDVESKVASVAAVTKALGDFVVAQRAAALAAVAAKPARKKPAAKAAPARKATAKAAPKARAKAER